MTAVGSPATFPSSRDFVYSPAFDNGDFKAVFGVVLNFEVTTTIENITYILENHKARPKVILTM